jgi:hypothetical protein
MITREKSLTSSFFLALNMCFLLEAQASEKDINAFWCLDQKGIVEFRTRYGTYVDCLTEQYAIEAEFDYNWKESIGQSLHYAEATGKQAAILFIKTNKKRKDYLSELKSVIKFFELPITVFVIDETD